MKKLVSIVLVLSMVFCVMISSSVSAFGTETATVYFSSINISINGTQVAAIGDNYELDNGDMVPYSILYQGTTYIPMRKLSELLGKKVDWDGDTMTATITSTDEKQPELTAVQSTVVKEPTASQANVDFNAINIVVDGIQAAKAGESYTLDNGSQVPYSILYKGTTYLPIRKISEILYKDVEYDAATRMASVNEAPVLPVIGYENMVNFKTDYGKEYDVNLYTSGIVNNMMTYTYAADEKTEENIKEYKKLLNNAGFVSMESQTPSGDNYSQTYEFFYNEKSKDYVGIIQTSVKGEEAQNFVTIALCKYNTNYKSE